MTTTDPAAIDLNAVKSRQHDISADPSQLRRDKNALIAAVEALRERVAEVTEPHDGPCYYCGRVTSGLAGNPSEWPLMFCHKEDPGKSKHHHVGCVTKKLRSAEAAEARVETEKRAPVQGYSAGIPWSMHLRAYDVYCKKYSPQPALINLEKRNCRGGFGTEELDEFIPGWRDELSKTAQLLQRADALDARVVALEGACRIVLAELPQDDEGIEIGDLQRILGACRTALSATPGDALERARAVEKVIQLAKDGLETGFGAGAQRSLDMAIAILDALGKEGP